MLTNDVIAACSASLLDLYLSRIFPFNIVKANLGIFFLGKVDCEISLFEIILDIS